MSDAKGPYSVEQGGGGFYVCGTFPRRLFFRSEDEATSVLNALNLARSNALAAQAERVKKLEADCEWLRSQWERHRKALNAIAWGEYDNVAFCRRLAQDELAIGVKVANDRASATVAALTPPAKGNT